MERGTRSAEENAVLFLIENGRSNFFLNEAVRRLQDYMFEDPKNNTTEAMKAAYNFICETQAQIQSMKQILCWIDEEHPELRKAIKNKMIATTGNYPYPEEW